MAASDSAGDEAGDPESPVRLVASIARGMIDEPQDGGGHLQVSINDFNSLVQQTKAMQDRIDTLEQQQQSRSMFEDEEYIGLINNDGLNNPNQATADDSDDGGDFERDSSKRLSESQVEAIYDEYEMPESAYTLLITEDVISTPFFVGIVAATMSLMCLALAFTNELDNQTPGNPCEFEDPRCMFLHY